MSVIDDILLTNKGRRLVSIAVLAHGLMVGDKATLKLGYSREVAVQAAIDALSNITHDQREIIDALLDARLQVEPVSYGPSFVERVYPKGGEPGEHHGYTVGTKR